MFFSFSLTVIAALTSSLSFMPMYDWYLPIIGTFMLLLLLQLLLQLELCMIRSSWWHVRALLGVLDDLGVTVFCNPLRLMNSLVASTVSSSTTIIGKLNYGIHPRPWDFVAVQDCRPTAQRDILLPVC